MSVIYPLISAAVAAVSGRMRAKLPSCRPYTHIVGIHYRNVSFSSKINAG